MRIWFKRMPEEEEERTYCGYILMQSDWYKQQVEAGLIDHSDCTVITPSQEKAAQPETQGITSAVPQVIRARLDREAIWAKMGRWFHRNIRGKPAEWGYFWGYIQANGSLNSINSIG